MHTYQLNDHPIIWSPVIRYLGVYISSSLKWTDHCSHIAKRASNTLNYIHHAMFTHASRDRSLAFKCLVWPQLEYASQVWTFTELKTFKCLRLFISVLLGGQHMLNGTVIPVPGLQLLRPVCKNFAGQALLTDMTV